ncbi:hypothetical protein [Marinovum algicola]|uniref:hypothetical protein n=1 Tax=Marinovum algicola TaxID=42444 RepID=UPI003B518034
MTEQDLIKAVEHYCNASGLAPATLCRKAVGNSRLHKNLVDGKGCTLRVASRLKHFMEKNPPSAIRSPEVGAASDHLKGKGLSDG